jgi:hypothetical protein
MGVKGWPAANDVRKGESRRDGPLCASERIAALGLVLFDSILGLLRKLAVTGGSDEVGRRYFRTHMVRLGTLELSMSIASQNRSQR